MVRKIDWQMSKLKFEVGRVIVFLSICFPLIWLYLNGKKIDWQKSNIKFEVGSVIVIFVYLFSFSTAVPEW
jgi:hypothetical protein